MSVQVVFRVSTGQSLDGDAPGTGGAIDISKKLSLVGSIPELGAWSLNKRVPIRTKPDLGEEVHKSPMADTRIPDQTYRHCGRGSLGQNEKYYAHRAL